MRTLVIGLVSVSFAIGLAMPACGGASQSGFGNGGGGGSSGSGGSAGGGGSGGTSGGFGGSGGSGGSSGVMLGSDAGSKDAAGDVIVTTSTTIYGNTDTQLYSLDPSSNVVTVLGTFSGMSGSTYDSTVTDCAVDAEGDIYVNTETVVYKATMPSTPSATATIALTGGVTIAGTKDQSFYALAFAPKGFLGSGETLIGGDNAGELWSIDPTSGTTQDLGNFGGVPGSSTGQVFALSGDMVFYTSGSTATGLATIRSCETGGTKCTANNDYLAGIDMTALATAYTSKTPAASLLGGIYGGSSTTVGPGTGYGEIFGLGAWEGDVYGFTRVESSTDAHPPQLISISTTSGAGSMITSTFPFTTGGWSGAGVTTTVTIKVPPPPPPPPQPK
jgi:hypothetical protein